ATATDHLGASSTSNAISVTVTTLSGEWSGTIDLSACEAGTKPISASLSQAGVAVTGVVSLPEGFCSPSPVTATIGAADKGRLSGGGAVHLHLVASGFDTSFDGQMDTAGQTIAATLQSGDLSGLTITL